MRRRQFLMGAAAAPAVAKNGFKKFWNEKDLRDFSVDIRTLWRVEDKVLVGRSPGLPFNEFLRTHKHYRDFHFACEFRMTDPTGKANSGIQFRSRETDPPSHEVVGYQADLGQDYWGCLYDESRRKRVLAKASAEALAKLDKTGWNAYEIEAKGPRIILRLNEIVSVDYTEKDPAIDQGGFIALQLHSGPPLEMRWRKMKIREL